MVGGRITPDNQPVEKRRENIWHGAIFRDEGGFFCAFEEGKTPSRPGAELLVRLEGKLQQIIEIAEAIEELLKIIVRREQQRSEASFPYT